MTWKGMKLPMELRAAGWRVRCRTRHLTLSYSTGITSIKEAKDNIRRHLERLEAAEKMPKDLPPKTLADVERIYKLMPKKAGEKAEKVSIYRLRSVVREVLGKELADVPTTAINARFWLTYIAKRQGREVAALGDRSPKNAAINSAMRAAAAIFKPSLRPLYAEAGIVLAPDATTIQWLPKLKVPRPEAQIDALAAAWAALRASDPALWLAIGLARFAGLRRNEVQHCTRAWVETFGDATFIRLRDRPEEGWRNKTGENYRALVIEPALAAALREAGPGLIVQPPKSIDRAWWFARIPQRWAKQFTGAAIKPLHRLRGLYLDDVASLTEDAEAARLAGIRAAADAAGHTSTRTTEESYLSAP